jgi:hypothetical protein
MPQIFPAIFHVIFHFPYCIDLMKAGRPSYHIPAKWITVNLPQGILYFEFGTKGNPLSKIPTPNHIVRPASVPSSVSEVQEQTPPPLIGNLVMTELDSFGLPGDFTDFDFDFDMDADL